MIRDEDKCHELRKYLLEDDCPAFANMEWFLNYIDVEGIIDDFETCINEDFKNGNFETKERLLEYWTKDGEISTETLSHFMKLLEGKINAILRDKFKYKLYKEVKPVD
jgi:hypothetical protein